MEEALGVTQSLFVDENKAVVDNSACDKITTMPNTIEHVNRPLL